MSSSEETKARKKRKGHGAKRYYGSFRKDTGTAESLSWIKDIKVRPKDRLRKTYYVKLKGDSKFHDDEKGLMLHAIEFLIDTFGSTAGVKMFAYPDQGRCCFYLAKYELKVVEDDARVLSVERAPNNAVMSVEKAPDSADLEQSRN